MKSICAGFSCSIGDNNNDYYDDDDDDADDDDAVDDDAVDGDDGDVDDDVDDDADDDDDDANQRSVGANKATVVALPKAQAVRLIMFIIVFTV